MAEGAQAPPTFKLVLVGDGGTGKASRIQLFRYSDTRFIHPNFFDAGTAVIT